MAEIPILFSDPMVRAILKGRKTRTRRLVTAGPSRLFGADVNGEPLAWSSLDFERARPFGAFGSPPTELSVPAEPGESGMVSSRIAVGDVLWVRECWAPADQSVFGTEHDSDPPQSVIYRADGRALIFNVGEPAVPASPGGNYRPSDGKWKPSIFLPRWASRLSLRVTEVRVERLGAITDAEILAEGIHFHPVAIEAIARAGGAATPGALRAGWIAGWNAINPGTPWASNPWVWAYSFEVIS